MPPRLTWLIACALASVGSVPTSGGGPGLELLDNGGFEDGLRGWQHHCHSPSCGAFEAASQARSGRSGLSLSGGTDAWTSLELSQALQTPVPRGQLSLRAWVQAVDKGPGLPAVQVGVQLKFEDSSGAALEGCRRAINEMPAASQWSLVAMRCQVPEGATRAWAVFEWACVRSEAMLLVDDVSLQQATAETLDEPSYAADTSATLPGEKVPRTLHLIFGLSHDFGGKPFGLIHHLVIKAAVRSLRPAGGRAYFYHTHEPSGPWWEASRPMLALRRVKNPTTIFGKQLKRFAHQADVLRLELLQQFGGAYMDMDIVLLRPLDELHAHELTLAHEGVDGTIGLGNALMLAQRNASLLSAWYGHYRGFSDAVWNGFSLRLPFKLAQEMPGAVHTVDYTQFYWPPWTPWGISQLYRTPTCIMPQQSGVHLWETKVWKSLLSKLTPEQLHERGSCFLRLAAAIMDDSYDFSAARVPPGEFAHRNDSVVFSSSLLSRLLVPAPPAPPGGASVAIQLPECTDAAGEPCAGWAQGGECTKNAGFMVASCRKSCGKCDADPR